MREINMIVVHCTASPDSADKIGIADVRLWHTRDNGWSDVGYHWLVNKQGQLEQGRDESLPGAHAKGYNKKSIGICWVGTNDCNMDQWWTMASKCAELCEKYNITIDNILGHCELPGVTKTCPNINMTKFRNMVQQLTGQFFNG